jgi:hypothetical protein
MGLEWIIESTKRLIESSYESKKITKTSYLNLINRDFQSLDDCEDATTEIIHFIKNHTYYDLLERVEKGEAMAEAETDPDKQKFYQELLVVRYAELEALTPKEDAA